MPIFNDELQPIHDCPMCRGTGQNLHLKHHHMVECQLCEGRGWVVPACKGCGRPAYSHWPKKQLPIVYYCGTPECLEKLVKIHKPITDVNRKGRVTTNLIAIDIRALARRDEVEELKEDIIRRFGDVIGHC